MPGSSRSRRPVQRARRLGLARRHAGREPAGRAAVRRRRRPDDRNADRPRPAALRRDRRRCSRRARAAVRRRALSARSPGDASARLSWTPPAFDGGSPVTNYKVYRGTSPGSESFHADMRATDELRGHRAHERDDLLLQGVRRERERRGRALRTRPRRPRPTSWRRVDPLPTVDSLQPHREPAV